MNISSTHLLGVKITTLSKNNILELISNCLSSKQQKKPFIVFTPNPEQLVYAHKFQQFQQTLNSADINLPDGVGVVWGLKAQNYNITRIAGIDFMEELVKLAAGNGYMISLIGGRGEVAKRTLAKLKEKYPGLAGWAEETPEFRVENLEFRIEKESRQWAVGSSQQARFKNTKTQNLKLKMKNNIKYKDIKQYIDYLAKKIIDYETRVLFVGLGAPKQEYLISAISQQLSVNNYSHCLLMSVGGAFDIISGRIARAPKLMIHLGLEWSWRLLIEPKRLVRQLQGSRFFWLIIKEKISLSRIA